MDIFGEYRHFWGGWFTGYVVPFLFVLTIVVFFHELGHFLVARWCGVRVLVFSIGFGPELFGFNDRHGTRWKVSAIPLGGYVKFFGDENAASVPDQETLGHMTRGRAARELLLQAGRAARRDRRGRADRQLHPRDRDLRGGVHVLRQAGDARARRDRAARQRRGGGGLQARRPDRFDQRPQDRDLHRHAAPRQHARRRAARHRGRTAAAARIKLQGNAEADRDARTISATCTASGVLGITGAREPPVPVNPFDRRQARGRGNLVRHRAHAVLSSGASWSGRELADQLGGPIRIAQVSGQVATAGFVALIHLAAVLVDLDRAAKPVPDTAARWWTPFVLRDRGGPRPAAVRSGQEYGFRFGLAVVLLLMLFATYNDPSPSVQPREPWLSGNALTTKGDPAGAEVCPRAETG